MGETSNIPSSHKLADLPGLRHLVIRAHVNEAFPDPVNSGIKGEVLGPVVKPELVQAVSSLLIK